MRIRDIEPEAMTPAQRQAVEEAVAGKRGRVPGPMRVWLHSPALAANAQKLGAFIRYDSVLGAPLTELAILVTARFWTSHYEWASHKKEALKAGLDPAIIAAVAARRRPDSADPRTLAVYDYATVLHAERRVPDAIYDVAVQELGYQGVVELVGILGYYTLVSMTLNAFEFPLKDGDVIELEA